LTKNVHEIALLFKDVTLLDFLYIFSTCARARARACVCACICVYEKFVSFYINLISILESNL